MDGRVILAPASIPQEQFLASDSTITLYAGAMGAGKSSISYLKTKDLTLKK